MSSMDNNGCSVIGTYNALVMLGLAKGDSDFNIKIFFKENNHGDML